MKTLIQYKKSGSKGSQVGKGVGIAIKLVNNSDQIKKDISLTLKVELTKSLTKDELKNDFKTLDA